MILTGRIISKGDGHEHQGAYNSMTNATLGALGQRARTFVPEWRSTRRTKHLPKAITAIISPQRNAE